MSRPDPDSSYTQYLGPRYWPIWIAIGLLRLMSLMPLPVMTVLGYGLGACCYVALASRRNIALKNISACFPELDQRQHKAINFKHFLFLGQAVMTSPINWWASRKRFMRLTKVTGREHYDQALADGRNVILLAPHFMAMEISGLALQGERPMIGMYQYMKNPLLNKLAIECRQRFCVGGVMFERKDSLRSILRTIKKGLPMQYSPDQDAMKKGVFVPFFHTLASTSPALGKFAHATNAVVIPLQSLYLPWGKGYQVNMGPPIEHFPIGDELIDSTAMNRSIEALIRKHPSQYLWVHKRFKTRPAGEANFYKTEITPKPLQEPI